MTQLQLFSVIELPGTDEIPLVETVLSQWLGIDKENNWFLRWPKEYKKSFEGLEAAAEDWPLFQINRILKTCSTLKEAADYFKTIGVLTDSDSIEMSKQNPPQSSSKGSNLNGDWSSDDSHGELLLLLFITTCYHNMNRSTNKDLM